MRQNAVALNSNLSLGASHGYRFDDEDVTLNAEIFGSDINVDRLHLQLWAAPASGIGRRVKVADLSLATADHEGALYSGRVRAAAPADGVDYLMELCLVSQAQGQGQETVLDRATYALTERFAGPHFRGDVGYALDGAEVELSADSVLNSREAGNLSGSLRLELRAHEGSLEGAYEVTAHSALESVYGEHALVYVQQRVPFKAPSATSTMALALCEWTQAHGFVTRDVRVFSVPFQVAAPAPSALPSNVVELRPAAKVEATPAAKVETKPVAKVEAKPAAKVEAKPAAKVEAKPAAKVEEKPVAKVETKPAAKAEAPTAGGKVSLNKASVDELAHVPGLTRKLATNITHARPFASLDDLVKVRGVGPKMLTKLRAHLSL